MNFELCKELVMPAHHRQLVVKSSFLVLFILASGVAAIGYAQEPEPSAAQGIRLYQQGDIPGAIKVLQQVVKKEPEDADSWYHLGLAFYALGLTSAARTPLERTVELRPKSADAQAKLAFVLILANEPQKATAAARLAIDLGDQSAEPHYAIAEASLRNQATGRETEHLELALAEADHALLIDPTFSLALLTKSFAHYHLNQYSQAAESLQRLLAADPVDNQDAQTWQEQIKYLESQARNSQTNTPPATSTLTGREVAQKARVLNKLEPSYTSEARKVGLQGTVVIRAVFSSDGEVKDLYVTQALPFGLTTNALKAARQIKFTPATKDGHAVSMYIQLEYNFNLY